MKLFDVNILINAHRPESVQHKVIGSWFSKELHNAELFGMSELVLSSFIRIVTNPRIYASPTPPEQAVAEARKIIALPSCVLVRPGLRHFDIFTKLCLETQARGNIVPDAYFAALAIESGCEWITLDRDYARFPGLKWRAPG